MFTVKWVSHGKESEPDSVEKIVTGDLDLAVWLCFGKFESMRFSRPAPPDGFLILANDGKEVRRWFGSSPPRTKLSA
jgi:hypothetical protein